MEAIFRLNDIVVGNDEEIIEKVLSVRGINEKSLSRLRSEGAWFNSVDLEILKKISLSVNGLDSLVEVDICGQEEIHFDYCDAMKKVFLLDLSEQWVSPITLQAAISALQVIEDKERLFNKCVIEFTEAEIKGSLATLLGDLKYHRLRNRINVISKLQFFYKGLIPVIANWKDYKGQKVIAEILGQEFQEYVLTRKDLIELSQIMANLQDSVIPILLFEGVRLSKIDDFDELRYLKKSDFKGNKLVIRGNGNITPREITIDSEVGDVIQGAIYQEMAIKVIRHEPSLVPLEETDYIIRKNVSSRTRKDTSYDEDVMSFRGVYSRVISCKNQLEALLYDIPFSPQSIATAGKVYYVNRYIAEGMDPIEAIRKTLVRFGVWYGDPEEDKQNAKNVQLVNRLKKVWSAYAK